MAFVSVFRRIKCSHLAERVFLGVLRVEGLGGIATRESPLCVRVTVWCVG